MRAILMAAGLMLSMPAAAQGPACELHVWGAGRPNFVYPARLLKSIDPASIDKSNPNATINTFNTVTRASGLPDADLVKLMPAGAAVTVVRHAGMIDTDVTPLDKAKGRLAADSTAACYADLVVASAYGIFPSTRRDADWAGRGLVGEAVIAVLAGGDRLVVDFRFRDFTSAAAAGRVTRRKNDTPLPAVPIMSADMKAAIEASSVLNLRRFVEWLGAKRK